jgi:hypothetical protein
MLYTHSVTSITLKPVYIGLAQVRSRVVEYWVLRKIFGPRKDEVTREWRRPQNEELNDPFSSKNIILMIKSRRNGLARHVACVGHRRGVYRVLVVRP